jgi:hypothetical protein
VCRLLLTDADSRDLLLHISDLTTHFPCLLLDFELLSAVLMKSEVFVNLAPLRLVEIFHRLMSCGREWLTVCNPNPSVQLVPSGLAGEEGTLLTTPTQRLG